MDKRLDRASEDKAGGGNPKIILGNTSSWFVSFSWRAIALESKEKCSGKKVGKIKREARGHLLQFLLQLHFSEIRFK